MSKPVSIATDAFLARSPRPPRFQVYRDVKGEWRWRLRSSNSRVIADSGEGYKTHAGVLRAVATVRRCAAGAWP